MATDWEIKPRSRQCTATGRDFADGEMFYTLLLREGKGAFRREDLCEEAWAAQYKNNPLVKPFSFWRGKFEEPPPPPPEPLGKQTAEALLRRFMAGPPEDREAKKNVIYFLALMLERKRILKPLPEAEAAQLAEMDALENDDGVGNDDASGGSDGSGSLGGQGGRDAQAAQAGSPPRKLLFYLHHKTGDLFKIPDPQLHLAQIGDIQAEVAGLLGQSPDAAEG